MDLIVSFMSKEVNELWWLRESSSAGLDEKVMASRRSLLGFTATFSRERTAIRS